MTPTDLLSYANCYLECYDENAIPRWEDQAKTVHAFVALLNGVPQIMFEGTQTTRRGDGSFEGEEWWIDIAGILPWNHGELGDLPEAFWLNTMEIAPQVLEYVSGLDGPYDLVGHSKGCYNAILMGAYLAENGCIARTIVAFEAPRAGGAALRTFLLSAGIRVVQTVTVNADGRDIVTGLPPWAEDMTEPVVLRVPDNLTIAEKHRLPTGVIPALQAMVAAGS